MTTLVATSVVRGSRQGESHGGVYLLDLEQGRGALAIDWNTAGIDWRGRGWDRGLRGIAFDGDRVFIAASDELFEYTPDFELVDSYRSPFLKHCHEISCYKRRLFLTSTAYDSILGFDLDANQFSWGLSIVADADEFRAKPFNPRGQQGPLAENKLHLNNVFCNKKGMYISGLKTGGMLHYSGRRITIFVNLPAGSHNARPWRDGILFNDTESNAVRYVTPGLNHVFQVPHYPAEHLTHTDLDDSRIARQSFARGLCIIDDHIIASGSSPSTITLHNVDTMKTTLSVNLSLDIRNAIHGLEVWPFPVRAD
ncbi:MAG: hypothetical protein GWP58_07735 [Gammaproteobacteria bacterium]|jgi:hypothetical protein|nr:hypothetical protein [Gammaproteobacteria bacterium]